MTEVRVPDVPGVIVGWRYWRTNRVDFAARIMAQVLGGGRPDAPERLFSCTPAGGQAVWPAQLPMRAACLQHKDHGDRYAPGEDCACGVYARRDAEGLVEEFSHLGIDLDGLERARIVVGQVELWGKVFEGGRGWRAEHARVQALARLWADDCDEQMVALAGTYQVPVVQPEPAFAEWMAAQREARRMREVRGARRGSRMLMPALRTGTSASTHLRARRLPHALASIRRARAHQVGARQALPRIRVGRCLMDIGEEQRELEVEPIPESVPEREPEKVPA